MPPSSNFWPGCTGSPGTTPRPSTQIKPAARWWGIASDSPGAASLCGYSLRSGVAFAQGVILLRAIRRGIRLDGGMTDLNSKPELDAPEGPAPEQLEIVDIVVGDGAEATPGATVDVHYLGVEYDSGDEFDSSWNRGQSINFPLGSLIAGWQQGIPGMKVGGRRKLVVPPQLAYGPAGGGHRLSGKTLIFVIDLLGVS